MSERREISGVRVKSAVLVAGAFAVLAPFALLSVSAENASKFRFFGPDAALNVFAGGSMFLALFIIPVFVCPRKTADFGSAARSALCIFACVFIQLPGMLACGAYSLAGAGEPFLYEAAVLAAAAAASATAALAGIRTYLLLAFATSAVVPFTAAIMHQFAGLETPAPAALSPFWQISGSGGLAGTFIWAAVAAVLWGILYARLKRSAEKNS